MRGLTLFEIVLTLALLSIIASLAIPASQTIARRQAEVELQTALKNIREAIQKYRYEQQQRNRKNIASYPHSFLELVSTPTLDNGNYLLPPFPVNPFTQTATEGWEVRAYSVPASYTGFRSSQNPGNDGMWRAVTHLASNPWASIPGFASTATIFDIRPRMGSNEPVALDGTLYQNW